MRCGGMLALVVLVVLTAALVPVGTAMAAAPAPAPTANRSAPSPARTGPYAVGRSTLTMVDVGRSAPQASSLRVVGGVGGRPTRAGTTIGTGRTLTVDVWYPSDPDQVVGRRSRSSTCW